MYSIAYRIRKPAVFLRVRMRVMERGGGGGRKGRKNTSGDYCTVFVSNGNVISAFGHAIIT